MIRRSLRHAWTYPKKSHVFNLMEFPFVGRPDRRHRRTSDLFISNQLNSNCYSISHELIVRFTGSVKQSLSYNIDLRDHLPKWVTLGFSGASEASSAMRAIYTWDFSSSNMEKQVIVIKPTNQKKNMNDVLWLAEEDRSDKEEDDLAFGRYMDDEFQRGTGRTKQVLIY